MLALVPVEAACAEPSSPLHRPPCTWNTFFAKSKPTVVISFMDGSLFAGGSRPTSTLAPRCRKGAIHPIIRADADETASGGPCEPRHGLTRELARQRMRNS